MRIRVTHQWETEISEAEAEGLDAVVNTGVSMMENHMRRLMPRIEVHTTWLILPGERRAMPEPRVGDYFPDDPTATEVEEALRVRREAGDRIAERRRREDWDRQHGPLGPDEVGHGVGEIEAVSDDDVEVEE